MPPTASIRLDEIELNKEMETLYRTGNRAKAEELKAQSEKWKACYLPEHTPKSSVLEFQFEETYGKVNLIDMDVKFTSHNEYTKESYIEIQFADYDRMKNWKRPEGATIGSITILKKNDSLTSPKNFVAGDYTVKTKTNKDEWIFYVDYEIKGHSYSGQFGGSNPSKDSKLKIIYNNGRLLELEFSLITEKGEVLKGNLQVVYPYTLF